MTMSETMSTSSGDWVRYHQLLLVSGQGPAASNELPNTDMGTSTTTNSSVTERILKCGMTRERRVTERILKCGMIWEGRVAERILKCGMTQESLIFKPIRKGSGVSKQTQTTLLRTTTNFRVMVQQFTAYPSSTSAPVAPYPNRAHVKLGLENSQPIANPNTVMVARAGYNLAQLVQQQFRHQQYMLTGNISASVDCKNAFLQELQSSRGPVMAASGDRLGMDDALSPVPPSFTRT